MVPYLAAEELLQFPPQFRLAWQEGNAVFWAEVPDGFDGLMEIEQPQSLFNVLATMAQFLDIRRIRDLIDTKPLIVRSIQLGT